MSYSIITDTCFWLGLVTPDDQHHHKSVDIAELIKGNSLMIPWPCMYETVCTNLTRDRERLLKFEQLLKDPMVNFLPEDEYRASALEESFESGRIGVPFSLADCIIRQILLDRTQRINYLITFNRKDFQDVCDQRGITIFDEV